ncbi:serine/threonine protein kinase, FIKK family, putative [Plasmodium sp. DRC-Itaito]|nr:serine/threonine protein kinase, FIKK family, putative [Plasmodium sp. DRC-Itaito]
MVKLILSKNIFVFDLNDRYIRELNEKYNIKLNELQLSNIRDDTKKKNKNNKLRTKYYDDNLFIKDNIFNFDIILKKNIYGCINCPKFLDNGGENYVMETAGGAFLIEYHPGISPRFYKLLYEL